MRRTLSALAASLLCVAGQAQALTVNAGETVQLPGTQPIGSLVLKGGTVYLSVNIDQNPKPGLSLSDPVTLQGGFIRSGTLSGQAGRIVRFELGLDADTWLSASTVLDGGYPGDGEALRTTNRGLLRQTDAGELTFWTLSSFSNLGSYQIENDLGMRYQDAWAPLEHREPYVERFANAGLVSKVAGSGTSVIGMPLDNLGGRVLASSGTLRLEAGGQHLDGHFQGLAGGRLELAGEHLFAGQTLFEGNVYLLDGATPSTLTLGVSDQLLIRGAGAGFAGSSSSRELLVNGLLAIEAAASFNSFAMLRIGSQGRVEVAGLLSSGAGLVNAGDLKVRPDASLSYAGDLLNQPGATLLNQGSLRADFDGARWGSLTNHGVLTNAAGASLQLVDVGSGAGSALINDGFITHSGRWELAGGLAIGSSGVLEMQPGASLTSAAGAQLSVAAGGLLSNLGGTLLHGGGQFSMAAGGLLDNGTHGTVIIESGSQLSGSGSIGNAGVFLIRPQSSVALASFSQSAGLLSIDGTLDGDVVLYGGTLNGNGYIQGNVVTGASINAGDPPKIYPGHSPGHLTVSGSLRLLAGAELQLQVERQADGSLAWDAVTASEMAFADGSRVQVLVGPGVAGADWQSLAFLECGSSCTFSSGVQFLLAGAPGSSLQWSPDGLTLSLAPLQAVPEPSSAGMLLTGLVWLLLAAAAARQRGGRTSPLV